MTSLASLALLWQCIATTRLLGAAETPSVPDGSGNVCARVRAELHRAVEDGRIAGGAHLVVRDGITLCSEAAGFADTESKAPFTADSILRIYSMSKPIKSVAAMRLLEQDKFGLDDPVARFIPAFALQQLPYTEELARQQFAILYAGLASRSTPDAARAGSARIPSYQTDTNILYLTGGDRTDYEQERCRLDLYYPTNETDFATVVWFHGGGLTGGNRSIPGALKEKGIAVVAAGYRLSPHVKSPAYIEDAAAAVAWTFRHIEKFGGSTNRIFVSGHSAGGYLTSMIGLDRRWLAAHGMEANRIAGLVPLSPQAITHFTIRAERGVSDQQPIVDDMAPLFHVRKDAPPMLLVTGDREKELLGRYEENAYFWRMLKVVGHPDAELIELKGYDHGQMVEPAYPLLLRFIERHSPASAVSPGESAHWN